MTEQNTPNQAPEQQPSGNQPASGAQPPTQATPSNSGGTSGLAIAGLVIGIIAALASFIPIINNGAFVIGIVGLVLAIAGLMQIRSGKKQGRGIAIAALVLCIVSLVITLMVQAACSAALDSISTGSSSGSASASATAADSAAAASASSASGSAASSEAESDYAVTIDSATRGADYNGNPAVIVSFTWQNNSDSAQSFATALMVKCFQNGVQLDTAIVTDGIDSEGYLAEVKPGSGTSLQLAYELKDESPVDVEVSEFLNFNNETLAEKTFTL